MKTPRKTILLALTLAAGLGLVPASHALISGETLQIAGHVRDELGQPVADVAVAGDDYVGDVYRGKTDANGYYTIHFNAEGNYRVTVDCAQLKARGYTCVNPGTVTLTIGLTELDFIVPPAAPPLVITNLFLPAGEVGAVYKMQFGAKGGRPPYQWQLAVDAPELPAGLGLNSRGLLAGKLQTNGMATIKVQVTDASDTVTNKVFSILINHAAASGLTDAPVNPEAAAK